MIAAIYARKSTPQEGAGVTSESVDRQIAHARPYAERRGWTIDESHIYFDDNVSGAHHARLEQRNRLVRLCEDVRPPFGVLIVSEQSRLGRDMIESAYTITRLADAGVKMFEYLADREIDVADEVGQAMTMLRGFGAASERRQTSRRVYDGALRRVRAGHVAGAKIFGYDNAPVTGPGGKRLHTLRRPNPEQAAVVRRIYELYTQGLGTTTIARMLNAERQLSSGMQNSPRRGSENSPPLPLTEGEERHPESSAPFSGFPRFRFQPGQPTLSAPTLSGALIDRDRGSFAPAMRPQANPSRVGNGAACICGSAFPGVWRFP
jgi:DNA invertase Pin-like site-specific DNA recombinase